MKKCFACLAIFKLFCFSFNKKIQLKSFKKNLRNLPEIDPKKTDDTSSMGISTFLSNQSNDIHTT